MQRRREQEGRINEFIGLYMKALICSASVSSSVFILLMRRYTAMKNCDMFGVQTTGRLNNLTLFCTGMDISFFSIPLGVWVLVYLPFSFAASGTIISVGTGIYIQLI